MKMSCNLSFLSSPAGCRPGVWLAWSLRLLLWALLLSGDTGPRLQGGAHAMKAHIPGDIILGGLFPIHVKGEHAKCGGINKDRGIQRLEAMLFAIDKINADPSLLDGVRLGATILDTCSSDSYALNQSLEFIRASINTADPHNYYCEGGGNLTLKPEASAAISGVIGGSYSEVSLQVANLLRLFRIPQISPASTGTALSDKTRYDFFARTVPPDTFQALAMVAVVQTFNWSYVSLVYSEGQYGESGQEQFTKEARHHNICIAISEKIPHSATDHQYHQVLTRLKHKPNAKGVVLFVRAEDAEGILRAAKEIKRSDYGRNNEFDFYWIASDGWGARKLNEDMQEAAEGAITIELESRRIEEFDSYMLGLTVENNDRNPWFRDYWEAVFECKIRNDSSRTEKDNSSLPTCSQNLNISATKDGYKQENKVQFVVDAVYAMAHAIDDVRKKVCGGRRGICPKLKELDGGLIYQALLNVTFVDLVNSTVRFDEKGDGQAPYIIYNYRRSNVTGEFHYERVGKWLAVDEGLHLNAEEIRFGSKETHDRIIPVSVCSAECGVGEVKKVQAGDHCCWICTRCEPHEYVLNESTCADCGESRWPHTDKKSCFDLELQYMQWESLFAIVPIGIALLGIFLTSGTIAVFIRNNETPIVKASGRELSYMLLSGILICYLMTFVLLLKPTPISCAAQRFGVGLGFSIIYGSLLTKTNRISRIFDSARRSARRPSFISPKSQMIITVMLISVQVVATLIWFLLEPPATRTEYPEGRRNQVILKCKIRDSSFLVSLVYNMFLITTCTVYAIKTRKIPENFNESKFIGFTMYTTCIIWLAFVPIYFGTGNNFQVQITTLCVAISLSAYVALFCLFSPKVYIILFHPDKNVRKLTMNSATYKKAPTSSTTGHAPQNNQPPTTCTTGTAAESCAETVKLVLVQTISSQTAGECGALSGPATISPPATQQAPPVLVQAQASSSGSNKSPPTSSSPPEASASTIKAVDDRGGGDCESLQSL